MAVTDRAAVRSDSFGFVMMTPQLFINYKLKSVAHLPWRAFMYKAFNTFIDDAFAMVSPAPGLAEERRYRNRSKTKRWAAADRDADEASGHDAAGRYCLLHLSLPAVSVSRG